MATVLNPYLNHRGSARESISMPLEAAPWGDTFGMCTDRFGVNWLVNIAAPQV